MIRYVYYLLFINMVANVVTFVPNELFRYRYEGAVPSLLLSLPLGLLLVFLFVRILMEFPGDGLPEIAKRHFPGWVAAPVLVYSAAIWFYAGALTLVAFADIAQRFVNPDQPLYSVLILFLLTVGAIARFRTVQILQVIEMLHWIILPFVVMLAIRSLTYPSLNWDAMRTVGTYVTVPPSWDALVAASYMFTGYLNLAIFHRVIGDKYKFRYMWILVGLGLFNLFSTFFIPIGMFGTEAVAELTYPWVSTSDAMRMELGISERVSFLFLSVYFIVSLISAIIHWHVGLEMAKSVVPRRANGRLVEWLVLGLVSACVLTLGFLYNDDFFYRFAKMFNHLRFYTEFALVALLGAAVWRKRKRNASAQTLGS